jgi:sulfopyruvate decarboxylase subunit beta
MLEMTDALATLRTLRGDRDVVITTMAAAKVWMQLADNRMHPLDMVFVPSCMGHATSFGLGIALAQPERSVIVCNGDGSMLMNLGSLVTIAAQAPKNLVTIIMDNGVYEVTGAQPMPARVDFAAMARASGFTSVFAFDTASDWERAAPNVLRAAGPTLVVLQIQPVPERGAPKSPGPAAERAKALRAALTQPEKA